MMADIEGRLGSFAAGAGPCGLGRGDGGLPGDTGGDPPTSATTDERGKEEKQSPESSPCFASLRLTSLTTLPCFLAHLIITAGCGCCITRVCIFFVFSLQLPCDLSTLHLTEHSIQVFLARFPFDRPLSSSIWCQRRSKYRSQTRRPKQRYRGELRVRAVCADRTM